ncbi:lactate utilization protein C [Wenjunlia vitaminophila]|uniref:Lactate utilization protein C n=1 Tax=Wenjunlia vitaminophila TaxID=76728 RepID=A0A0T6LQZ5_WENVI|nr:LUD domain-containing protein [Wenjunlia vitaminophila]KRV48271.1 lactate utilization protein C [Wenjunlia vitaminophila]
MKSSREVVLARVRAALADVPRDELPEDVPVPRDYLRSHTDPDPGVVADLLAERLVDYGAVVHRPATEQELPELVARVLRDRGASTVAVPEGLPPAWLPAADGVEFVTDDGTLTAQRLDRLDSVVTGCAVAIAETGTIVLDAGPGQGRRLLTLVPDHHLCVVRPEQVVASVPLGVAALSATRPLTWISGPSATSDIELNRVEGVHGPRTLEVVLLDH